MLQGALFDMDGVLVDNTAVHTEAFAIFCQRYGVKDWREKLAGAYGMGNDDILRLMLPSDLIRTEGLAKLGAEKEALYREIYAPRIRPVRGLCALLERLRDAGIRLAVGSSGPRENVDMVLDGCGIREFFQCIVSGDRVSRCKPDPEIYFTAAAGIGLRPADCVVFEDAPAGIESARRAGAGRIVALATSLSRAELETTAADRIVDDFSQVANLNEILK